MPLNTENGSRVAKSADGSETFYLFYGQTPCFSNFHPSEFTDADGQKFFNTEQYFHYKKAEHFGDENIQGALLRATTPGETKKLGRKVQNYEEEEWNRVGYNYMKNAIRLKFTQNEEMKKELLRVKNAVFVECSPRDRKWGIGLGVNNDLALDRRNWRGQNLLGNALTEIRDEILTNEPESSTSTDTATTTSVEATSADS